MEQKRDGMNYAPKGKPAPVVAPGEFCIAAVALDHGHIYGMCNGLIEAGAKMQKRFVDFKRLSRRQRRQKARKRF